MPISNKLQADVAAGTKALKTLNEVGRRYKEVIQAGLKKHAANLKAALSKVTEAMFDDNTDMAIAEYVKVQTDIKELRADIDEVQKEYALQNKQRMPKAFTTPWDNVVERILLSRPQASAGAVPVPTSNQI